MKAIVQPRYGAPREILQLQDLPDPTVDGDRVLVRTQAAGVNAYDWHMATGEPLIMRVAPGGRRRPAQLIAGRDVAGIVEAVGADVDRLAPGDEVFGSCDGSFAEFGVAREAGLVHKPARLSFEEAAGVPMAALTAFQGLTRHADLQRGQHIAITGASGGVGTFAVQIAKDLGAEVTAVCSTRNLELVRDLGADHVVDYTREDVTRRGAHYDVILDLAGRPSLAGCRRSLTPRGMLVSGSGEGGRLLGPIDRIAAGSLRFALRSQRFAMLAADEAHDDLVHLARLLDAGRIRTVIDRTFPLADAPTAVAYLHEGHTRGKTIITV